MTRETVPYNGRHFPVVSWGAPAKPATKKKAHRAIPSPLDGEACSGGVLTLATVPPSVNGMFFNRRGGKGRGKTLAYRNWRAFADRELRDQPAWHVPGKVNVRIQIERTRGDCDNRIKAALDCLVSAGRIEDDKNVVKVSAEFASVTGTRIEIERAG